MQRWRDALYEDLKNDIPTTSSREVANKKPEEKHALYLTGGSINGGVRHFFIVFHKTTLKHSTIFSM